MHECAAKFTRDITAIGNVATYAEKGMLPDPGTILDQPAWFVEFWQALQAGIDKIQSDRLDRISKRGSRR